MSTPTPPPPSPYSAPAPLPIEPQQPGLSEPERLIDVFLAPRKTFDDIRRNASWWAPLVVSTLVTIFFAVVVVQKVDMMRLARHQAEQSKIMQRQMEQLSPEQQEQQLQISATFTKWAFFASPFFPLLGGVIVGALLLAVFNFGFAAEVTFPRALAVAFYAYLPKTLYALLLTTSLLVTSDPNSIDITGNPMPTNPAFFMDPSGNKFLYSLMSNLDVFALWTVVLLGIGFAGAAANRKLKAGPAVSTMLAIYGILILIGAGFKALF